jgi:peptidoglycan/xylan/chitin deacetylase (PgdA/CDA1 family)
MIAPDGLARRIRRRFREEAAARIRTRVVRATNPRPMISFTFDDVAVTASTQGAAILERFGARGTYYVAGGLCGTQGEDYPYLAADDCLALHATGHEIACHTFSHRHLADATHEQTEDEIARNRSFFAHLGGIHADSFAYPFGGVSLGRKRQLDGHFVSCRTTLPGINGRRFEPGCLRAVGLWGDMAGDTAQRWIDRTVAENGWLIFVAHDLSARHGPWGCTPKAFAETVERAVNSGSDVLSVRDALARAGVAR